MKEYVYKHVLIIISLNKINARNAIKIVNNVKEKKSMIVFRVEQKIFFLMMNVYMSVQNTHLLNKNKMYVNSVIYPV